MTDKRVWPVRAMYMLVAAALVISLVFTAAPASPAVAADNDVRAEWERVPTPTTAGWVLAPNSQIIDYAVADEGEVAYAVVEQWHEDEEEYVYRLLKSTNHAATWSNITPTLLAPFDLEDEDRGEMLMVATDGDDADFVAVALWIQWDEPDPDEASLHVLFSTDGGGTFTAVPDGDLELAEVYDLAVSAEVNDVRTLAIGGYRGTEGRIFRARIVGESPSSWEAAHGEDGWLPAEAVVAIAFSPNWAADSAVLAVTFDAAAQEVHLQSGTWGPIVWNEDAGFAPAVQVWDEVTDLGRFTAGLAVPRDYNGRNPGQRILWVWVNYVENDAPRNQIRRVSNADAGTAGPMSLIEEGRVWLTNISYLGDIDSGKALAGVLREPEGCEGIQVYFNDDIARMIICCIPWSSACKPPTGSYAMAVSYVTPDKAYAVALHHPEYDPRPYDETAWSWSFDNGDNWNQLSLIDTHIEYISDVAVSPDCNKTMLVTVNPDVGYWDEDEEEWVVEEARCDSVWLHAGEELPEAPEYTGHWIRTWSRRLRGEHPIFGDPEQDSSVDYKLKWGILRLNPEETEGHTVFLADVGSGRVYRDGLEGLGCWQLGTAPRTIVDLAVKNDETIYVLGENGHVVRGTVDDFAFTWATPRDSRIGAGWTIAVWNDDIIVGGQHGHVAHSADGGETFPWLARVPAPSSDYRLVSVAFDSYFGENDVIYAAVGRFDAAGTPEGGDIYMWILDESTRWVNLLARPSTFQLTGGGDKTDSNRVAYTGLVLDDADGNPMTGPATGGVLYASYVAHHPVFVKNDTDDFYVTGAARALTPLMEVDECVECPVEWDFLIWTEDGRILDEELFIMAPQALKICGCLTPNTYTKIFAIGGHHDGYDMDDAEFGTVWMFEDCYSKVAVDLRQPEDGFVVPADPCECENEPFIVIWDRVCDACKYEIQIASDPDFAFTVLEIPPMLTSAEDPHATIGRVLVPGRTYYWRVRAREAGTGQQIRSWWSEGRSLAVAPAPGTGVSPSTPALGATDVRITDIPFSWTAVEGADSYNWELSRNADFDPTVATATGLETTSYLYTGELNYDTTYFWRVTAIQDGSPVSHTVGSFTTRPEPQYCHPQTGVCFDTEEELRQYSEDLLERPTPTWVWVLIAIGAVLVIVVIVLIFRTRRV